MIDKTSTIEGSSIDDTVSLYRYAVVRNSIIEENSSIGDFSKVEKSSLGSYVRIDRYNHISGSDIGYQSYTGMNSVIIQSTIGKFTSMSWGVTIGPGNHNYKLISTHSFLYNDFHCLKPKGYISYNRFREKCRIGNDVWIGCNSTILRGVTVGDGAVIGANSVVTRDVPPYSIVVGSPAEIIKYRFEEDIIVLLLELKWWNWSRERIKQNLIFFEKEPSRIELNKLLHNCKKNDRI